jgi:hypothetical protein
MQISVADLHYGQQSSLTNFLHSCQLAENNNTQQNSQMLPFCHLSPPKKPFQGDCKNLVGEKKKILCWLKRLTSSSRSLHWVLTSLTSSLYTELLSQVWKQSEEVLVMMLGQHLHQRREPQRGRKKIYKR